MLRIATFNIGLARLRLAGIPVVDAVPHAAARLPHIVDALAANRPGADIWLLQEAYHPGVVSNFRDLDGFTTFAAADAGQDTGLCILVRADWKADGLSVTRFRPLDWLETVVARKGAMCVNVDTPMGRITVGNLHASYDGRGRRSIREKAPGLRAEQVAQSVAFMEARAAGRTKFLGGDFNLSGAHESAGHAAATDRGWRDLREDANTHDDAGVRSWSLANPLASGNPGENSHDIDLIFMKDAGREMAVRTAHVFTEPSVALPDGRNVPLSDHYALMAEVEPVNG